MHAINGGTTPGHARHNSEEGTKECMKAGITQLHKEKLGIAITRAYHTRGHRDIDGKRARKAQVRLNVCKYMTVK